ncbi:MAG: lasso peptide biosynthesis B2 protein [Actinomycetota bacterium]
MAAFLRRTPEERLALLRALPVLLRIEAGLRRDPVPRLAARLGVRMGTEPDHPPRLGTVELDAGEQLAADAARRLVRRWPASARCLRRSLLLGHALRHRSPVLRIGVARHDGRVHAHAWIEIDGTVPREFERDVDFTPLRRARRR